jgi:chemotaxis signal transduction protein
MVSAAHPAAPPETAPDTTPRVWAYLVALRGKLYAVPDDERAVLMPHIGRLPAITPLPSGLVPAHVLGLANVGQRGEVVIDLAAFLGLGGEPAPPEQRCLLVMGESAPATAQPAARHDPYRLGFAVDMGLGLIQIDRASGAEPGSFARELVSTDHGQAVLLDMEAICGAVVLGLGAERRWNAPAETEE